MWNLFLIESLDMTFAKEELHILVDETVQFGGIPL
jgi:hypothetical protein